MTHPNDIFDPLAQAGSQATSREEVVSLEGSEKIVFAKGEHVFEDARGTVVVHAPRDVALGEVLPALARLAAESAGRKECGNAA